MADKPKHKTLQNQIRLILYQVFCRKMFIVFFFQDTVTPEIKHRGKHEVLQHPENKLVHTVKYPLKLCVSNRG